MCFWDFHFNVRTISFAQCSWAFNSNVVTILVAQCFWAFNSIDYFMFTYLFSYIVVLDTFCLYMISIYLIACLTLAWGLG